MAADLHTWRRPDVVARLATLVVVGRGGSPDVDPALGPEWRVDQVGIPPLEISSSDLRPGPGDGRPSTTSSPTRQLPGSPNGACTLGTHEDGRRR